MRLWLRTNAATFENNLSNRKKKPVNDTFQTFHTWLDTTEEEFAVISA